MLSPRESPDEDKDSLVHFSNHCLVSPMKQEAMCYSRPTGLCKETAAGCKQQVGEP